MKKIEQETNSAAVLEIFHPNEDVICQHLDEGLGNGAADNLKRALDLKEIKSFALEHPIEYLKYIKEAASRNKKDAVMFKIFPNHIKSEEKLRSVLYFSEILLMLRRNTLQSYISNKKAIKVGTYANVDTSGLRVQFCAKEFFSWRKNIHNFFNSVLELSEVHKNPVESFNYEELYSNEKQYFNSLFDILGVKSINDVTVSSVLRKQDNSETAEEKVVNSAEMIRELDKLGLSDLNSVFSIDKHG